ncbi:MAG: signal recognition particle receptor subunit alpha, partial [Acidimicrobiales bacterium]
MTSILVVVIAVLGVLIISLGLFLGVGSLRQRAPFEVEEVEEPEDELEEEPPEEEAPEEEVAESAPAEAPVVVAPPPPEAPVVEAPAPPEAAPKPRIKERLGRARALLGSYITSVRSRGKIDDDTWEELEEALILADVGVATTTRLLDALRSEVKQG